jgi:adenylate cyclase
MYDIDFGEILRKREQKNERTVALARFLLGLTGFREIIALATGNAFFGSTPSTGALLVALLLLGYSVAVLILVNRQRYFPNLKYFVIALDYFYVFLVFATDAELAADLDLTVWYAFAGTLVFYLINLLRYSKSSTIFAMVLTLISYSGGTLYLGVPLNKVLQVGLPLALILYVGYVITAANKSMLAEANAKQKMERYLPPQLVTQLSDDGSQLDNASRNASVNILFADIRSFTRISEVMEAERVVDMLNAYLTKMTEVIFRHGGTIDKFIGDAIMTVFGAPFSYPDDSARALRCAIEMQQALRDFNNQNRGEFPELEVGIGLHYGDAIAGNIGSRQRLDYTVIGDSVNLASRIEGLSKFYRTPIIISEKFKGQLDHSEEEFLFRPLDTVVVKGRSQAVGVYEVMIPEEKGYTKEQYQLSEGFSTALAMYRKQEFNRARELFAELTGDYVARLYLRRCERLIADPPPTDWRGVHTIPVK